MHGLLCLILLEDRERAFRKSASNSEHDFIIDVVEFYPAFKIGTSCFNYYWHSLAILLEQKRRHVTTYTDYNLILV